ncbi:DNA alkylation repair protein [Candidatus Falkowbacteria bacterium]|nr:DNA alkylation repair protein [Candidatus Falkowbacteria bacterium]
MKTNQLSNKNYRVVRQALQQLANPAKATILSRFFKTGPGEYGQGDIFWGITVPEQRTVAKQFSDLPLKEIKELLTDPVHEVRLTAGLILVDQYRKNPNKHQIYLDFYLNNLNSFNNWDMIDLTAPKIIGEYLVNNQSNKLLKELSRSKNMWIRRAAMVANLTLIKSGDYQTALKMAPQYLNENHDLLHKATGWVLREVGKRNQTALLNFLDKWASRMPRVMLRYSIEKLPEPLRQKYLQVRYVNH